MAFFKFRKGAEEQSAAAPAPESIETLRKRARHRLVGAFILVLAGVVGFPLLFDNQPRPIAVDIPIDIPDKAKVQPLAAAAPAVAGSATAQPGSAALGEASTGRAAGGTVTPAAKGDEVVVAGKAAVKDAPVVAPKAEALPKTETVAKPEAATKPDTSAKPLPAASKPADKKPPTDVGRFVVQFGTFADPAKAREARLKVEKTGMKTYAQVIQGADGKKIRVRVGPFEGRVEAEKAAAKIKKLDLPTAILEL